MNHTKIQPILFIFFSIFFSGILQRSTQSEETLEGSKNTETASPGEAGYSTAAAKPLRARAVPRNPKRKCNKVKIKSKKYSIDLPCDRLSRSSLAPSVWFEKRHQELHRGSHPPNRPSGVVRFG